MICYLKSGEYDCEDVLVLRLAGVIMARYRRGKMALYEVMSKAKVKPGYGQTLEKMRTDKAGEEETRTEKEEAVVAETAAGTETAVVTDESAAVDESGVVETAGVSVQWRRKPRIVQYNGGRIEFSVPYQIGIAIVLGLVVVMLLAFRVGQRSVAVKKVVSGNSPVAPDAVGRKPAANRNEIVPEKTTPAKASTQDSGQAEAVTASTGSNPIVLVEYFAERDLVPVRAHFASYGIATEIVRSGNAYFLITQDRYDSIKSGDGYLAKQRITEVGADYKGKAPAGYEAFAPHYFSDAYRRKID